MELTIELLLGFFLVNVSAHDIEDFPQVHFLLTTRRQCQQEALGYTQIFTKALTYISAQESQKSVSTATRHRASRHHLHLAKHKRHLLFSQLPELFQLFI